jgi:hypothetical protein
VHAPRDRVLERAADLVDALVELRGDPRDLDVAEAADAELRRTGVAVLAIVAL